MILFVVLFLMSTKTLFEVKSESIQNTFTSDTTTITYSTIKESKATTEVQCTINCARDETCAATIWSEQMGSANCTLLVNQGDNSEVFNSTNSGETLWIKEKKNTSTCPRGFTTTEFWCLFVGITNEKWSDSEDICQSYGLHVHLADVGSEQV